MRRLVSGPLSGQQRAAADGRQRRAHQPQPSGSEHESLVCLEHAPADAQAGGLRRGMRTALTSTSPLQRLSRQGLQESAAVRMRSQRVREWLPR